MKKLLLIPVLAAVVFVAACTASQIQEAEQLAGVLLQDVPQLVILFGGSHLSVSQTAQVKSAFADADASYALLKTALDDYKTAGPVTTAQKVQFAIAEAQKDLTPVLAIAGQNNPQLAAGIQLALNTGAQIAAIFPSTPTPAALKASNLAKLPSAKSVDAQFKRLLVANSNQISELRYACTGSVPCRVDVEPYMPSDWPAKGDCLKFNRNTLVWVPCGPISMGSSPVPIPPYRG